MKKKNSLLWHGQSRFHIQFDNRRTTISVDNILSSLMTTKLGFDARDPEGKAALRKWIEEKLREDLGKNAKFDLSKTARLRLVEEIADKELSKNALDSILSEP